MTDREKVIKGMECCDGYCDDETGCPYFGELESFDCQEQLRADAIALLKEQEPRVMTLEEVTEDRPDVVWFDDKHYKLTYPAFVSNGEVTGWVVSLSKGCYERHDHIDGYGKEWRCWTSRPDEKRRAETPWN